MKDWRQLEEKGFLWRFFVRHHKKAKQDMPDALTLCYYMQRAIAAALRWFVWDRLFWIFSPLFFALSVSWLIFALVGMENLAGGISFIVSLIFSSTFLVAEVSYWVMKLEGTKLGKWLEIIFLVIFAIIVLVGISGMVYGICITPKETLLPKLCDIGILFGIIFAAAAALIGVMILFNKLIFKSRNWRFFVEWLKAVKKKMCPIIFYPLGFKLIKFRTTQK